jgi:hypothetical protein
MGLGIVLGLAGKVAGLFGGKVVEKTISAIKEYFPPSMSEKEKAGIEAAIRKIEGERAIEAQALVVRETEVFNDRIKAMEGTAEDLKSIPYIGAILIFLRGTQRPVWGFATLYFDYMAFSSSTAMTDLQLKMLMAINLLVLGFLFGERAVKNILPLISAYFDRGGK